MIKNLISWIFNINEEEVIPGFSGKVLKTAEELITKKEYKRAKKLIQSVNEYYIRVKNRDMAIINRINILYAECFDGLNSSKY